MTHFTIFPTGTGPPLLELPLGPYRGKKPSFEVQETMRIGFRVDECDRDVDYQIKIGDNSLEEPQDLYSSRVWPTSSCLDGASGITPIRLLDRQNGKILAELRALVEPSKLSAEAYVSMFDDMRRISVELLLDLISKSRLALSQGTPARHGRVQPLTPRLELSQIRDCWQRFSSTLAQILEEPHVELRNRTAIRRPKPGERLNARVLRRFSQQGQRARDAIRSGELLELPTVMPTRDTRENRVIVGFIDLLRRRAERRLMYAKKDRDMRLGKLRGYGPDDAELRNFYHRSEEPKIGKLDQIVEEFEEVVTEMRRAIRSFGVPVQRIARQYFLESFESPIFRNHPQYSRAARLMRKFLNNNSIVVEQGDTEDAKPIETIFEQWFFFQVSAGLQAAGLSCISHNSIFEPIARDRFSVDLDRNASIDFKAPDERLVRLRYEPTILPFQAAKGFDTIYRGVSDKPWTPDTVIEIFEPLAREDPREYHLVYAAVIDAKYTSQNNVRAKHNVWTKLDYTARYTEIRNVDTDKQIARQVWVAAPIEASLRPYDEAVTWSEEGELDADPSDVILGVIGADPKDPDQTGAILKAFILGMLNHAEAYAVSNSRAMSRRA